MSQRVSPLAATGGLPGEVLPLTFTKPGEGTALLYQDAHNGTREAFLGNDVKCRNTFKTLKSYANIKPGYYIALNHREVFKGALRWGHEALKDE